MYLLMSNNTLLFLLYSYLYPYNIFLFILILRQGLILHYLYLFPIFIILPLNISVFLNFVLSYHKYNIITINQTNKINIYLVR